MAEEEQERKQEPILVPNDKESEEYWDFWRRITDLYEEG